MFVTSTNFSGDSYPIFITVTHLFLQLSFNQTNNNQKTISSCTKIWGSFDFTPNFEASNARLKFYYNSHKMQYFHSLPSAFAKWRTGSGMVHRHGNEAVTGRFVSTHWRVFQRFKHVLFGDCWMFTGFQRAVIEENSASKLCFPNGIRGWKLEYFEKSRGDIKSSCFFVWISYFPGSWRKLIVSNLCTLILTFFSIILSL